MTTAPRRIGLLGGTFDPPHYGHLHLARCAQRQLALDEVRFLPVGDPTHKARGDLTPVAERVAMTVLAIATHAAYHLDLTDVVRPEPHYTATLLPLIHTAEPQAALWLVIGGDSLRDLHRWHAPEAIVAQARLAVLARPGAEIDWEALAGIPDLSARIDWLTGEQLAISSTAIRAQPDAPETGGWLPQPVLRYLRARRLYNHSEVTP